MYCYNYYFIGGGTQKQWTILRHNGPLFPPEYIPHKIPVIINNKEHILPE
jgi:DNA topoisomerase-1